MKNSGIDYKLDDYCWIDAVAEYRQAMHNDGELTIAELSKVAQRAQQMKEERKVLRAIQKELQS